MKVEKSKKYKENNSERGLLSDTYHNNFRRLYEKVLSNVVNTLFSNRISSQSSPKEEALINELRKNTKGFNFKSNGFSSEDEWMKHAKRVANMIQIDDPRRFLTWNAIKDTMCVGNYMFIVKELKYLKSLPDWETRWKKVLLEDKIGQPTPFFLYPKSSGNIIHHAYVLAMFENMTKKKIKDLKFIFDFGAGYGSVCRLAYRLGFKGKYLMYDIPVFSQIQTFYLENLGKKVLPFQKFLDSSDGICCLSEPKELLVFFKKNKIKPKDALLLGMWSISESPLKTRELVTPHLSSFSNYLFGYQDKFGEVDNNQYFEKVKNNLPKDISWKYKRLYQLPGHNFLCGTISGKK